jgi:hypothetical protein
MIIKVEIPGPITIDSPKERQRVTRKPNSVIFRIEDHFHPVGAEQLLVTLDFPYNGSEPDTFVGNDFVQNLIVRTTIYTKMIRLNADDYSATQSGGDFGGAVRTGAVFGGGHNRLAAEIFDNLNNLAVVGGNHQSVDSFRFGDLLVETLDKRFTGDGSQDFTG